MTNSKNPSIKIWSIKLKKRSFIKKLYKDLVPNFPFKIYLSAPAIAANISLKKYRITAKPNVDKLRKELWFP